VGAMLDEPSSKAGYSGSQSFPPIATMMMMMMLMAEENQMSHILPKRK
jgi:hypothetical protein